jgi:hypothetical protein
MAVTQFFDPFTKLQEGRNTDSLIEARDAQAAVTLQTIAEKMDEKKRYRAYREEASTPPPVPGQPAVPGQGAQPSPTDMILGELGQIDNRIRLASKQQLDDEVTRLQKMREATLGRYTLAVDRESQQKKRMNEERDDRIKAVSQFAGGAKAILMDADLPQADKVESLKELESAIRVEHPEAFKVLSQGQDEINWGDRRVWARMNALETQAQDPIKRQELALSKIAKEAQAARDEAYAKRADAMVAAMREGSRREAAPHPVTIKNPDGDGNIVIDAKTKEKIGDAPARPRDEEAVLAKQVTQLSKGLEQAKLPEVNAVIESAQNAIKANPKILEYATGPGALLPDAAVPADIRLGRQAIEKVFNIELKNRSGAAVTSQELQRLKDEYGRGAFKTPAQLEGALKQARGIIATHYRSVAAGFSPEVLQAYNDNLTAIGGKPVIDLTGKSVEAAPAGAPAPYSDEDKEKRYQEWKAKKGNKP